MNENHPSHHIFIFISEYERDIERVMIECRELVDSVKADTSASSPGLTVASSDTRDMRTGDGVKIVLDKDGNICRECTDLQVSQY